MMELVMSRFLIIDCCILEKVRYPIESKYTSYFSLTSPSVYRINGRGKQLPSQTRVGATFQY
jgi:hypothetical protein